MKKVGVALLGLGTVAGGTYKDIDQKSRRHQRKTTRRDLEIRHILKRICQRLRRWAQTPILCHSRHKTAILKDPEIKIVAEFFGGIEPAKSFLVQCLLAGKSILTANKEMFSQYWHEPESAAKKCKAVYFEASLRGRVHVIKTLTESMQGNNIKCISGHCKRNHQLRVLSKMADEGLEYETVLKECKSWAMPKQTPPPMWTDTIPCICLSILSSLAFHTKVPIDKIYG